MARCRVASAAPRQTPYRLSTPDYRLLLRYYHRHIISITPFTPGSEIVADARIAKHRQDEVGVRRAVAAAAVEYEFGLFVGDLVFDVAFDDAAP